MSKTESQTRKEIIDVKLHDAGWNVNDCTQVIDEKHIKVGLSEEARQTSAEYEASQFSDYVFLGKDGKPLSTNILQLKLLFMK